MLSDPSQALSPPATAINAAVRRDSEYALAPSLGNLVVSNFSETCHFWQVEKQYYLLWTILSKAKKAHALLICGFMGRYEFLSRIE